MARALIPLATGFEDIEAVTIIDILRRGGVEVVTASVENTKTLEAAHGIFMRADALFSDVAKDGYDAIILPGGSKCADAFKACEALTERLKRQKDEGGLVCAICASPIALVVAGVLDPETQVTCYPTCRPGLDREWASAPVVADGIFITGQAPGSAMLFALVILERLCGEIVARKVSIGLVTDVLG